MAPPPSVPWWRDAVVYQIYPRSFADADGDGVGDLEGIRRRLDHLRWLGVDALWLSPIYRSPMADFGYDVADHTDVDPTFGDLGDFDRLLASAKEAGLRVMLDWVPNHTSDQHPWFLASRSSVDDPKRDWYFWHDGRDGDPPNNWRAAFGGRAWTFDERTGQWYLHLFLPAQPDLRWANPDVEAAMHDVLRFWLDRGVDGFRADVVHLIGKDGSLPNQPAHLEDRDLVGHHDHPSTHELLRRIRTLLDDHAGERVMVGEVNLPTPAQLVPYYGDGDELHLVFNFALLHQPWDADRWAATVLAAEEAFEPVGAWPVWVLSNHDQVRHRSRYGGSEARARVAATVLLTLRGTPFLYAGEELGLEDAEVSAEERVDPGGRDGCRAPIPWEEGEGHGWGTPTWLPWPPQASARSAARLRGESGSILHLYRELLALRRGSAALRRGSWRRCDAPSGVLAYERTAGAERLRVYANFGSRALDVGASAGDRVVLDSGGGAPRAWDGRLPADTALVVDPGP